MLAFEKVWKQTPDARRIYDRGLGKFFEQNKHLTIQLKMDEVVNFTGALPQTIPGAPIYIVK
ncbi:MAG: hypothetical protein ABI288_03635 [Ginsengibacter sp.]